MATSTPPVFPAASSAWQTPPLWWGASVQPATTAQPPPPLLLNSPALGAPTDHREGVSSSQTAPPVSQVRRQGRTLPHTHWSASSLLVRAGLRPGLERGAGHSPQCISPTFAGWGAVPIRSLPPNSWGPCLSLFPAGSYCLLPGLAAVSGPCSAGFHCTRGASVPNPTDGITGDLCPPGHFCPQGSPRPTPCPPGGSPMGQHQQCGSALGSGEGRGMEARPWGAS